ncbi:MAG: ABC transporter permease [Elusimicrobiota bacterium]|jgi:ABC-2 type transport system permease protein|nr:ABC transporter permease [Elusimicrobiota bacterium]
MNIKYRALMGFIKKEFTQIRRDKKMIAAIFFVPVVQLIMFSSALTSEVKNISFAVLAKPQAAAREIEARAFASGWFKAADAGGLADAAEIIIERKAEAVLVLPKEGFDYALERGGKPLQLLINAVNAQRAQQIDAYVKQIVARVAAARGYGAAGADLINIDTRVMFNHYTLTPDFMIPGLIAMASFIVILVVCGMSIAKEKEAGTMEKLIASPASAADILLGKTAPYFIIGMLIILLMFFAGVLVFDIPFRGRFWQLLITGAALMLTALSTATLISVFTRTQQQAMMASVLFILPAILLSGVFFPTENIPPYLRWLSWLDPLKYAMVNFRAIFLKGGDMTYFWHNCLTACGMAVALAAAGFRNFKSTLD